MSAVCGQRHDPSGGPSERSSERPWGSVATGVVPIGNGATAGWLQGGLQGERPAGRLFLQHGPINLVVEVEGARPAVEGAQRELIDAFPAWLGELVDELPRLRAPENAHLPLPRGAIARAMVAAARALDAGFVTAMAAVAGAIADEACALLASRPGVDKAYVNNGGDIAFHLAAGRTISIGLVPSLREAGMAGRIHLDATSPVRGVATSGWQGRSHSLGIADSVTVLAPSAAEADAAATVIASAVDVAHPGIHRVSARELADDSDLGERLVTVDVPPLPRAALAEALDAGAKVATGLMTRGAIHAAALTVQGQWRAVGMQALAPSTARAPNRGSGT